MRDFPRFSVLMSVYYKENPEWLVQSIESVLHNTILPSEIVIVKDGKLTVDLEKILTPYENNPIFKIVGYEDNRGLGKALNFGLSYCTNEFVARMDSDDICYPKRFEIELLKFDECPELSIVGSNITEFIDNNDNIVATKEVPETKDEIIKYAKIRNPFNHPSVMFRKSEVEKVGGYLDLFRCEDYYLWYRMIKKGCIGYNIQENLVNMRTSKDFYRRRGGLRALQGRKILNKMMFKDKYINWFQYIYVSLITYANAIIPSFLRGSLYRKVFRRLK